MRLLRLTFTSQPQEANGHATTTLIKSHLPMQDLLGDHWNFPVSLLALDYSPSYPSALVERAFILLFFLGFYADQYERRVIKLEMVISFVLHVHVHFEMHCI